MQRALSWALLWLSACSAMVAACGGTARSRRPTDPPSVETARADLRGFHLVYECGRRVCLIGNSDDPERLTDGPDAMDEAPDWSPDGLLIERPPQSLGGEAIIGDTVATSVEEFEETGPAREHLTKLGFRRAHIRAWMTDRGEGLAARQGFLVTLIEFADARGATEYLGDHVEDAANPFAVPEISGASGVSVLEERTTAFGIAKEAPPASAPGVFAEASDFVAFVRGSFVCIMGHLHANPAGTPATTLRAKYSTDELRASARAQYDRLAEYRR